MTTKDIRQKLHEYIDSASDKKVKAFYVIVEDEIDDTYENSLDDPSFLAEMERRYEHYKANPSSAIPLDEVEKKARQLRTNAKAGKK